VLVGVTWGSNWIVTIILGTTLVLLNLSVVTSLGIKKNACATLPSAIQGDLISIEVAYLIFNIMS